MDPLQITHEPHPKNTSKESFVLPSYLVEKKGLRFDNIFLNNTEHVFPNPESFFFSEKKNGYGKIAASYHANHLVKNQAKWFWRFDHFSETRVSSNLNQGVL